jgi:hypothetical protein
MPGDPDVMDGLAFTCSPNCRRLCYWPTRPSIRSRSRSAWPQWRAYSSIMWTSTERSGTLVPSSVTPLTPRSGEALTCTARRSRPRHAKPARRRSRPPGRQPRRATQRPARRPTSTETARLTAPSPGGTSGVRLRGPGHMTGMHPGSAPLPMCAWAGFNVVSHSARTTGTLIA